MDNSDETTLKEKINDKLIERDIRAIDLESKRYAGVLKKAAKRYFDNMVKLGIYASAVVERGLSDEDIEDLDEDLADIVSFFGDIAQRGLKDDGLDEIRSAQEEMIYKPFSSSELNANLVKQYSIDGLKDTISGLEALLPPTTDKETRKMIDRLITSESLSHEKHEKTLSKLTSYAKQNGLESAIGEKVILDAEREISPTIDDYMSNSVENMENLHKLTTWAIPNAYKTDDNDEVFNLVMKNMPALYADAISPIFDYLLDRVLDYASKLYGDKAVLEYKKSHALYKHEKLKFDLRRDKPVEKRATVQITGVRKEAPQDKYDPSYG